MSHDAPLPVGNTARSVEGSGNLHELMEKCTTLEATIHQLEDDLKQTKKLYKDGFSMLMKKM